MLDNPPLLTIHRGFRRPDRALVERFPVREVWITTDRPEVFARLGFRRVERGPDELEAKLQRICGWKQNVVTMLREKE